MHRAPGNIGRASPGHTALLCLAWFVGAGAIRVGIQSVFDFDGLWGQDPWGYLTQAHAIVSWLGGGELPIARWPQGYPATAVLLSTLGVALPAALQWTSLLAGAATVPLVWLAARAWWPQHEQTPGRVAALLVMLSPVHVLWSMCATSDALATAAVTGALVCLGKAGEDTLASAWPRIAWAAACGALLALALSTRLACGLLLPAFAIGAVWHLSDRRVLATLVIALSLALVPQLILWLSAPESGIAHPWLTGWRPWHMWQSTFETVDGAASYRWPQAVFAAFSAIHPGYLGTFSFFLAAPAALYFTRQRGPGGAVLLAWTFAVWLFFAGMPYQNFRFGLLAITPWALLAGLGAARMWQRRWVKTALVLAIVVQVVWAPRVIVRHLDMAASRRAAAMQIDQLLPKRAQIFAFGLTADLAGRTGRAVLELATTPPPVLEQKWPSKQPSFVVASGQDLAGQWRGRGPALNFDWLAQHGRLTKLKQVDQWTIWALTRR